MKRLMIILISASFAISCMASKPSTRTVDLSPDETIAALQAMAEQKGWTVRDEGSGEVSLLDPMTGQDEYDDAVYRIYRAAITPAGDGSNIMLNIYTDLPKFGQAVAEEEYHEVFWSGLEPHLGE